MKKLFAFVLLMFGITLASCGGPKQDLTSLRQNEIDADIIETLNINFNTDTNSMKLFKDKRDEESYIDIYVANDYKNSLFITELDLNDRITDRVHEIYANTLTFGTEIYPDEQQVILNELYNKDYGISKLELPFEIDATKAYSKNVYQKFLLEADKDLTELKLSVVYLPVLAARVYKNQTILKAYMFVPVHMSFISGDKELKAAKNDKGYELVNIEITGIEKVTPLFTENGEYLVAKKKTEEK